MEQVTDEIESQAAHHQDQDRLHCGFNRAFPKDIRDFLRAKVAGRPRLFSRRSHLNLWKVFYRKEPSLPLQLSTDFRMAE